jgi:hypothetical protein
MGHLRPNHDRELGFQKMTDQGKAIQDCVSNLITLYRQLQTLLISADELVSADRWVPFNSNAASHGKTLDTPEKWLAQYVFRFYGRPEPGYDHILLYLSAILFDSDDPSRLKEPILTAGWAEFGIPADPDNFQWEDLKLHLDIPGAANDGVVMTHDTASMGKRRKFSKFGTLSVQLVEIDTMDALRQLVIVPLLDRVNKVVLSE